MKTILSFFLLIFIVLLPSCKTQCQILEEQVSLCKSYLDCSTQDLICTEIENAQSLIRTINSKITEGTSDKNNIEDACSFAISEISVNNCIDAQKIQNGNWQDVKYLMSNLGLFTSIDKINRAITIKTTPNTNTTEKCGNKILKDYLSIEVKEKDIRISIMETFSTEVVPIMQVNTSGGSSNIFIGDKYITNENSTCDFNRSNRFDIDYKNYDYIFCSKSSGWLSETETTQSNCALTRQEVFLINWEKDYFSKWCSKNCKNTSSYCQDGNDYKCTNECNKICYELREKLLCGSEHTICYNICDDTHIKNCKETCDSKYISCKKNDDSSNCKTRCQIDNCQTKENSELFYECLEYSSITNINTSYSCCGCKSKCKNDCSDINSTKCKTCQNQCVISCISENKIDVPNCYKPNISKIENCYYNKIKEIQDQDFQNCINGVELECNNSCQYDTCIYSCLESNECSDYECFEKSIDSNSLLSGNCNNYSCYYNCQKQCSNLKIDNVNSKIMSVYREVGTEITGSNCDETEVFTKNDSTNEYYDYCVIEHKISD